MRLQCRTRLSLQLVLRVCRTIMEGLLLLDLEHALVRAQGRSQALHHQQALLLKS